MSDGESRLMRLVGGSRAQIFELVFIVVVAIGLALAIQSWAVKPYQIPSGSMEPTLDIGQRVIVDRLSTRLGSEPEVGDIVVFHPPLAAVPEEQAGGEELPECGAPAREVVSGEPCPQEGAQEAKTNFIKRVVAGPGDRLKIVDGVPVVNGEPIREDWETIPCAPGECDYPVAITIPADHYFMMGDNRPGSDDSRFWGPVPREWIVGHAILTYWPPSRAGGL